LEIYPRLGDSDAYRVQKEGIAPPSFAIQQSSPSSAWISKQKVELEMRGGDPHVHVDPRVAAVRFGPVRGQNLNPT
jgi:hypothetical protein